MNFDELTAEDAQLIDSLVERIREKDTACVEIPLVQLFLRQIEKNQPYRAFCENSGVKSDDVTDWKQIPAIPARAFKLTDLSCMPLNKATVTFYSSGTTEGHHSKHYMDASAEYLYSESLKAGFRKFVGDELDIVALMPSPNEAPNSSLSYMLGALNAREFHWSDQEKLSYRLGEIESGGNAIVLFGTAFAFIELFDSTTKNWTLPHGSKIIETGGFKGRTREVSKIELYSMFSARLGVSEENIIAEYGMSEMASQFYNVGGIGFEAPHWLRWRIIDPVALDDGDIGLLRVYDLANWNSVAVIQTQDMVRRLPGDRFELLGRATDAELRGCSLMVEDRWVSESKQ